MEIKKMKYTKDQQEVVEMTDKDCIFCKIAGGNIPSSTVYEDEQFRVILDLSPATKGHALILPKQHYANIFEIDEHVLKDLIVLVNIVQNNGEVAGQTVFHFHMHIIPRYKDDGQVIGWNPQESDPEVQAQLAAKIGQALK